MANVIDREKNKKNLDKDGKQPIGKNLKIQQSDEERELQRELASAIERLAPLDEIRILLAGGARVDEPVIQGLKPIHYAVYNNFLPAVKLFISRGCNINAMVS